MSKKSRRTSSKLRSAAEKHRRQARLLLATTKPKKGSIDREIRAQARVHAILAGSMETQRLADAIVALAKVLSGKS